MYDLSSAHLSADRSQICETSAVKQIQCRMTEDEHSDTSTSFEEDTDVAVIRFIMWSFEAIT
jgi:hypothetical protein